MNSGVSIVSSCMSHEPYGLAHCLVETRKSLTADECLADVFASVDLPDSIDPLTFTPGSIKWMLVVPRADTPTDTINERLTCDVKILVSK